MPSVHLRSEARGSLAMLWPDLPIDPSIARRVIRLLYGVGRRPARRPGTDEKEE